MSSNATFELAVLFQAVEAALRQNQATLNQSDAWNGNHGDHMIAIFHAASSAAQDATDAPLAEVMLLAASRLDGLAGNDSARLYALGLRQVGEQFQKYAISVDDLVAYVAAALDETKESGGSKPAPARSGDVLKALVAGIAGWGRAAAGGEAAAGLDMGALFEFGMAYLQAKQRGGSRVEVLAETAASVSPLNDFPYRHESGRLAFQALLQAMQKEFARLGGEP